VYSPAFPTAQHERASRAIVQFFSASPIVEAVLLTGSCARGVASPDSCLDVAILVAPGAEAAARDSLMAAWRAHDESAAVFRELRGVGRFSQVDLGLVDGQFEPGERHWLSGPDSFELDIGNALVYSAPLWERGGYFGELTDLWLPYYGDDLREARLGGVVRYCTNNLDHIPPYVERGLHFQSFNRLYDAFQEFLQALFIAHRIYPISYDKWIREQVEGLLGLPELCRRLAGILEISRLESRELVGKAEQLRNLLSGHVVDLSAAG
jgi:hypothetical protein